METGTSEVEGRAQEHGSDISRQSSPNDFYNVPLTMGRLNEVVQCSNSSYCFLFRHFEKYLKINDSQVEQEIAQHKCSHPYSCGSCNLKGIVLKFNPPKDRNFVQRACFERLRYIESQRKGRDIGEKAAEVLWFEEGFYERFRQAYNPEKSIQQIFDETIPQNFEEAVSESHSRDPGLLSDFSLILLGVRV